LRALIGCAQDDDRFLKGLLNTIKWLIDGNEKPSPLPTPQTGCGQDFKRWPTTGFSRGAGISKVQATGAKWNEGSKEKRKSESVLWRGAAGVAALGKSFATIGKSVDFCDIGGFSLGLLVEISLGFEARPVPRDKLATASTIGRN
jgi:hypothetical protein